MQPPHPFNARAARRLREALGQTPDHIAYSMRASHGVPHITPHHIAAWERGTAWPTANELIALAAALWCAPSNLMGHPRTLLEHRLSRGIAAEDLARLVGLKLDDYRSMEETGRWAGDKTQTANLGRVLNLPPSDLIAVTGLEDELAHLLTEAVSSRWQAHIRPIAKLIAMDRRELQDPLRTMHQEYQNLAAATLSRAGPTAGEAGARYLDNIVKHFWARLADRPN
ncbi:XRE family transcriptional regulator [Streptomyces profundus]|uniref:XRE family transcriptional regulator n=1 Tax=Streptomyces profundus TaxID=2867410 RepID=UPI001D16B973|nr:XRE family transcriptional regulator [Streptomyces sp. MA3_2.13]UED87982.1 XRE family transcriptional regulator [Streptomyces sp. MA3_2.13]